MDNETRERIKKEARAFISDTPYGSGYFYGYIKGATSEHSRITELLKEERNKAIEECIEALSSYRDIDRTQMKEVLEALKGKQQ